ncbi:hypothetical protein DCC85_02085 [Paenibacillus sp. CAA11]|uniref:hypothetical protein n=1 Tax=Paenibacillus sp. CAA11 TaxID=1532905 RepID=UPI000D38AF9C|nr:hypothetical protein [Paenibacillus sp. CAA11]AWB43139.1 hypothetical protein DCC85_02085 [Paenibacillus sp. CAA11]
MRNIAIGLLIVVFASLLIEPLVEVINAMRERIVLNTSVNNAFRSARDRSLEYSLMRNLDASVDREKFVDYFSDAFESAMDLTRTGGDDHQLTFTPNNPDKYNEFVVTLTFEVTEGSVTDPEIRQKEEVTVDVESAYKFKTKYLKLAEAAGKDVNYKLVAHKKYELSVKN